VIDDVERVARLTGAQPSEVRHALAGAQRRIEPDAERSTESFAGIALWLAALVQLLQDALFCRRSIFRRTAAPALHEAWGALSGRGRDGLAPAWPAVHGGGRHASQRRPPCLARNEGVQRASPGVGRLPRTPGLPGRRPPGTMKRSCPDHHPGSRALRLTAGNAYHLFQWTMFSSGSRGPALNSVPFV
jgi:hypothetical protein